MSGTENTPHELLTACRTGKRREPGILPSPEGQIRFVEGAAYVSAVKDANPDIFS